MNLSKLIRLCCGILFLSLPPTNALARSNHGRTITIQFENEAADIDGSWDASTRSDFVEAMNTFANDVSASWRNNSPVVISSDVKSAWRLFVVDHPIYYGGVEVGGYHYFDRKGPYAIFDLNEAIQQEGAAGPFLFASHEIAEMLADPHSNRIIGGWLAEIADPVVCCHYNLALSSGNVVAVSDFVLPAWFSRQSAGPYDFTASIFIQQPLQLGPGGY